MTYENNSKNAALRIMKVARLARAFLQAEGAGEPADLSPEKRAALSAATEYAVGRILEQDARASDLFKRFAQEVAAYERRKEPA